MRTILALAAVFFAAAPSAADDDLHRAATDHYVALGAIAEKGRRAMDRDDVAALRGDIAPELRTYLADRPGAGFTGTAFHECAMLGPHLELMLDSILWTSGDLDRILTATLRFARSEADCHERLASHELMRDGATRTLDEAGGSLHPNIVAQSDALLAILHDGGGMVGGSTLAGRIEAALLPPLDTAHVDFLIAYDGYDGDVIAVGHFWSCLEASRELRTYIQRVTMSLRNADLPPVMPSDAQAFLDQAIACEEALIEAGG